MNLKAIVRLLIWGQLFSLMALVFMPTLIRWLPEMAGKALYALYVGIAITLAVLLRRALSGLDRL